MPDSPFVGIVFVARQASSEARVLFHLPRSETEIVSALGVGAVEFAKFAMPAQWLMNRKLDFEIEKCGPSIADRMAVPVPGGCETLRFVSFPCDCSHEEPVEDAVRPVTLVTAFNVVFVLNSSRVSEDDAELYWQALATLSRAFIAEEERCFYLSSEVDLLSEQDSRHESSLKRTLETVFHGLRSAARGVSLYVNDSILTHVGIIPFSEAPDPPQGHQALVLTCNPDSLQSALPVDSASNVRRVIDAADPSKTIKDHMIELGLPISTIQRISQHLIYWKKAKIVHPLNKRLVLALDPAYRGQNGLRPTEFIWEEFRAKFGTLKPEIAWFQVLHAFSMGKRLSDVRDLLSEEIPQLQARFTELCTFLLSNGVLTYSAQFFRYFPPLGGPRAAPGPVGKRFGLLATQRPKFQNLLPHEIRSEFSPVEFEIIFERLKFNAAGAELMVKLISKYAKKHKDLLTARVELSEQNRCTNEDFHRYTESLLTGYLDSLLVKYDADP